MVQLSGLLSRDRTQNTCWDGQPQSKRFTGGLMQPSTLTGND